MEAFCVTARTLSDGMPNLLILSFLLLHMMVLRTTQPFVSELPASTHDGFLGSS